MDPKKQIESDRAFRIALRIREHHIMLANIYENLVDRDFVSVEKEAKKIIIDMRLIIKSMEDDDF